MKTKLLTILIFISCIGSTHAMRCSGNLIMPGDHITRAFTLCGEPPDNSYNNVVYINKDGEGMNYYIHAQSNGIIDSIEFSRN